MKPAGKKRASKIYKQYYDKGMAGLKKEKSNINSRAEDDGIKIAVKVANKIKEKVNTEHGGVWTEERVQNVSRSMEKAYTLQMAASAVKYTAEYVKNSEDFKQALKISNMYKMDEWDSLAKKTKKQIENYTNINVDMDVEKEIKKLH